MKKAFIFCTCLMIYHYSNAQIGINTPSPDPSSALDITSDNKGVLLPRIALSSVTQQLSAIPNATSLLIYNTGSPTIPKGFYTWDGNKWIQLIDKTTADETAYWARQGANTTNQTQSKSSNDVTATTPTGVNADIFQVGKVGIGYSRPEDININFNINKSPKQLDIAGDFRTTHFNSNNSSYYGIETNSIALPPAYAARGNVLYNADSKDLEDYSYFDRPYNGSMLIQSKDKLHFLSRTGKSTETSGALAHEISYTSINSAEIIYSDKPNGQNHRVIRYFDPTEYSVYDENNDISQFGLDFTSKKFYIGNKQTSGFYFPNSRPYTTSATPVEKDNQILKYNKAAKSLEWSDNVSTPKYFYMPSVLLPTISSDALIGSGSTANYTYDSGTSTFSVKIYSLFSNQFSSPVASSSSTATSLLEFVKTAAEYDYYITSVDANVFTNVTVNSSGILTYKINPNAIVRNGSFMNIVLKVK